MQSNDFFSLGLQPVSNRFMIDSEARASAFELAITWDQELGCPKLATPFPVSELKPIYPWITCFEPEDHLDELVEQLVNLPGISKDSVFFGYCFKDVTTLDRLKAKGFVNNRIVDPAADLGVSDPLANVETYQAHFNQITANGISKNHGKCDVLIVRHVLEHAYDLEGFIAGLKALVADDGYIVLELPDCERGLRAGDCTVLWEEHLYYFSQSSLKRCLHKYGLKIISFDTWQYPLENSMVAIVKPVDDGLIEDKHGVPISDDYEIFVDFKERVTAEKNRVKTTLEQFHAKRGQIAILGAGHLTIAFISILGLESLVSFVIDDNQDKCGKFLPIGGIEIRGSDALNASSTPICLLGANPQHHKNIRKKFAPYIESGGSMPSIFVGTDGYVGAI